MRKRINRLFQSSISDTVAQKIIVSNYIESLSESQQIEVRNIALRLAMYYSDWSDALETYIALLITDNDDFLRMKYLKDTTFNAVKEVVNKISMLYNESPSRKFITDSKENDEIAENVYKNIDIDRFGKRVNRMYNLLNDVIILVDWNPITENIFFRLLNRSNCDVVVNRYYPGIIEKLIIYVDNDIDSFPKEQDFYSTISGIYRIVWTKTEHYILNDKDEKITIPGRKKGDFINGYGIIPCIDIHKEPIEGLFWNPISNNELMELMFHICFEKTLDNHEMFFNSFKEIWLVGEPNMVAKIPDNIKRSPGTIQKFPTIGSGGSVTTVDTTGAIEQKQRKRENDKKMVYDIFGASVEFAQAGYGQSGEALKVRNVALQNVRQEQIPDFTIYEIDAFKIVRIVHNYWASGQKINENTTLELSFPESEVFVDRESKLKFYWNKYIKGLISGAAFYQTFNPTIIDEQEAERLFIENISKYRELWGEPDFSSSQSGNQEESNIEDLVE